MAAAKTPEAREEEKQRLWLASMEWGAHFGCHQKPERSLFLGRWQMPVCARCFGFWLGSLAAIPAALAGLARFWQVLLALPMAIDGLTQRFGQRESNNLLRYLTGWLAGFGYMAVLLKVLVRLPHIVWRGVRRWGFRR